jgi:hypothetical protein
MDRDSYKSLAEAYEQINEDWRDLLKGTPLGRPYTEKEKQQIRQGLKNTNDRTIDKKGIERALSTDGGMTQDQESGRTNIPRTDAQGNRIYTDADRPGGYHTINKDGKDIRRFWDANNKKWTVDPPSGFTMGADKPNDPAARQIRRDSAPGPKVFDMRTDENPLDTLKDQGAKAWAAITGQGPGPKDKQGLDDPLGLGDATGLKPQGNGGETPAERAARRERVGVTGNGEAGSPTGITPEVARKQNAADAAAGRSTVRDTATGEPNNVGGGGSDSTPTTNTDGSDVTQKGPNSAGLTPMQQWAKNFPELAKKVKPGQAGYDEINKTSSTEPSSPALTRSNFSRNLGTVNSGSQNMNRNVQTSTPNINRPNLSSNMNKVKAKVGQAFAGLPEEVFIDMLVQKGLAPDSQSAKAISEHMSPEYRAYLEENWGKNAGEFVRNLGSSIKRATEGKKVRSDANPVHRAVNSFTRGVGDTAKAFGAGLTGNSTVGDKRTQETKKETESSTPAPKAETKAETPSSTPASSTPAKPKQERAPKKQEPKGTSRLDSALKWASDSKNKDAWMKSEAVGEPKVHYLKDMDPYDPRRAPRDHAPGSPLPPPSYRPGLPDMSLPKASKKTKDERKPKKA